MRSQSSAGPALRFRSSRFRFAANYLLAAVLLAASIAVYVLGYSPAVYAFFVGLAVFMLIVSEMKIRSDSIELMQDAITVELGLLSKKTRKINYHSISEIDVKQSFLQRLVGYGDMEIVVLGAHLHQNISHHFAGKGDITLGSPDQSARGIVLKNFQNVRRIESEILSRAREKHRRGKR
ncbi:MAG: PH domain-containing protein [Candidatus Aenigmarchaeota archaeon]|nr:PH domain-containing protein [Candidatus Aenigmarchaeota archaeon]